MPNIGSFNGIRIRMFFNDHPPPHFHARYGGFKATVDIGTRAIINGQLPAPILNRVRKWAKINQAEPMQNWQRCQGKIQPTTIAPLP